MDETCNTPHTASLVIETDGPKGIHVHNARPSVKARHAGHEFIWVRARLLL